MSKTPAFNLRLPPDLKAQAEAVGAYNGLSLNALCVMALRSFVPYLARKGMPPPGFAGLQATTAPAPSPDRFAKVATSAAVPVVGANQPCPCGSGQKYKRCHGAPGAR